MNSGNADRSISSNISLPAWMKTRITSSYDCEQHLEDDSFFFIPYPLSSNNSKFETAKMDLDTVDAKHIEPTYLTEVTSDTRIRKSPTMPEEQMRWNANQKSNMEDTSSRSMVSVAQNMFTGRLFGSYLSSDNNSSPKQEVAYHSRERRNSKSLPASPLSSPKIHRKNPYFTDPFAKPNETFEPKSGWILSIMSQRKSIEDLCGSNAESVAGESKSNSPQINRHNQEHPPELREMNFWSPVSM